MGCTVAELTPADVAVLEEMLTRVTLSDLLLGVSYACGRRAETLGGAAEAHWLGARETALECADVAREDKV